MIDPTRKDIGRSVIYRPKFPPGTQGEDGVISSFNARYVHVKYRGEIQSKATNRHDLFWLSEKDQDGPKL